MKINRANFLKALQLVQPALTSNTAVENGNSFIFEDGYVCTYSEGIAISHPLETGFEGAVPAKKLFQLLKLMKAEEVEVSANENELLVKGNKAEAGLHLETEINLSIHSEVEEPKKWYALPEEFAEGVQFCLLSVGKDESKPLLTCLHITNEFIQSCDDIRITRYFIENKTFPKGGLLLAAKIAKELLKCEPVEFGISENWLHFRNKDDVTFSCKIFEEDYPELEQFLEIKGASIQFPNNLAQILDKANVMSDEDRVTVLLSEKNITVKGSGEGGWFKEKCRVKYTGNDFDFNIQPSFLKAILSITQTATVGTKTSMLKFESEKFIHAVSIFIEE